MESKGILEPSQHGFRPGRQTRHPIVKLQYLFEESKRRGGKLYVAYLDWFSAFCSTPHAKIYQLLAWAGMQQADINTIKRMQQGSWLTVATDFGDTAEIPLSRGTPQGDTLSPTLFDFFVNACLRMIESAGVGFTHACGVRRNHCCFADDIALTTTSVADMNALLQRISTFSEWSGMRLNLNKCEVSGYNFATKKGEPTHTIQYREIFENGIPGPLRPLKCSRPPRPSNT